MMGFLASVKSCLSQYATFSGRATRAEFWFFVLFFWLTAFALTLVDYALFGSYFPATNGYYTPGYLPGLFAAACLLPWFAATWRRMHDSGRPGFWPVAVTVVCLAIFLVGATMSILAAEVTAGGPPLAFAIGGLIGWLAFLAMFPINIFLLSRRSTPGPNAYGPHPTAALESVFE